MRDTIRAKGKENVKPGWLFKNLKDQHLVGRGSFRGIFYCFNTSSYFLMHLLYYHFHFKPSLIVYIQYIIQYQLSPLK